MHRSGSADTPARWSVLDLEKCQTGKVFCRDFAPQQEISAASWDKGELCNDFCNDFSGWNHLEEIVVLAHYDSRKALSQIFQFLVHQYLDQVPAFLKSILDYMKSPAAPVQRAAMTLTELESLKSDLEPSVSNATFISKRQVKWACHTAATPGGLLRVPRKVFCGTSSSDAETLVFKDSPFKRKRSLEVPEELSFKV